MVNRIKDWKLQIAQAFLPLFLIPVVHILMFHKDFLIS